VDETQGQPVARRRRFPLLAVLAVALTAVAFGHASVRGAFVRKDRPQSGFDMCQVTSEYFAIGWPVPFGEYMLPGGKYQFPRDAWNSFHLMSATAAVCDVLLAVALVAATGVCVFRLVHGIRVRLQFTLGNMFALTTAVAMVLGLLRLDGMVEYEDGLTPLHQCGQFDRAMVLFAVGCAVALIVSTVTGRLGSAKSDRSLDAGETDAPPERTQL
jgi:hypothetical protein